MELARIVSGGQTGVDRAALDAAADLGLPYGGWCPAGGRAEDFPEPPGLRGRYPLLRETPDAAGATRTRWNVRDSDATLVLRLPGRLVSPGTGLTVEVAERLGRPCLVATTTDRLLVVDWLAGLGWWSTLNVAGPRESEQPGVDRAAYDSLVDVLRALHRGRGLPG